VSHLVGDVFARVTGGNQLGHNDQIGMGGQFSIWLTISKSQRLYLPSAFTALTQRSAAAR
jgi:hypothetical protein